MRVTYLSVRVIKTPGKARLRRGWQVLTSDSLPARELEIMLYDTVDGTQSSAPDSKGEQAQAVPGKVGEHMAAMTWHSTA